MKKLTLLLTLCLALTAGAMAQRNNGRSNQTHTQQGNRVEFVGHGRNIAFNVYVDGVLYDNAVNIVDNYEHEFVIVSSRPAPRAAVCYFAVRDRNTRITVSYDTRTDQLVLSGVPQTQQPRNPRQGQQQGQQQGMNGQGGRGNGQGGQQQQQQQTQQQNNQNTQVNVNITLPEQTNQPHHGEPMPPMPPQQMGMPEQDFSNMLRALRAENYDDQRLNMARTAIAHAHLTTNQISQLAGTFQFENHKLDFLKEAYRVCVDKQNYYTLAEQLTYLNNRRELTEFIQRQQ